MFIASSARAHERVLAHNVLAHNVRDFSQAKFDSEINVRFLLNGHGDLCSVLLHHFGVQIICFYKKIIVCKEKKLFQVLQNVAGTK